VCPLIVDTLALNVVDTARTARTPWNYSSRPQLDLSRDAIRLFDIGPDEFAPF